MTDPRHARILADIARQVVAEHRQRYTLHPSGSTTSPDKGNVPVPYRTQVLNALGFSVDDSWNYTLPERYQATLGSRPILNDER